jgi:hypothetical protein
METKRSNKAVGIALIIVFWIACGYVNFGLTLGKFTHNFPDQYNLDVAEFAAFTGPFGLPVSLLSGPHHWRTTPLTTEERWEAFQKMFPGLGREWFDRQNN